MKSNLHFSEHAPRTGAELAEEIQEALAMAAMISLRGDLRVELGDWWAFNWKNNVITLPLHELQTRPKARCAWIVMHEAAHAALTRLHEIVPEKLRQQPAIHYLLNCIEDVRIESWLVARFPGSLPWQEVTKLCDRAESDPFTTDEHPARAFLRGLMELGETQEIPAGIHPAAGAALLECRSALENAFACLPPATTSTDFVEEIYKTHPVAAAYREVDSRLSPPNFERWVRMTQATMWDHVRTGVLPAYLKLIEEFGEPPFPNQTVRVHTGGTTAGTGASVTGEMRRRLEKKGNGSYLAAVQKHDEQIRSTTDLLLELLPNHRGLKHVRGRPSGDRIDLRVAMQCEANPRLHNQLWMQRVRRTLPDPAFAFLVDRSFSMKQNGKATAAFESMVIVRESCSRAGIPFSVLGFNHGVDLLHAWQRMSDARAEAVLGSILEADGGTNLVKAMKKAAESLEKRPERDRFLFLLTDGDIAYETEAAVREAARDLEQQGIHLLAIGIGTEPMHRIFPDSETIQDASQLPEVLGKSLTRVLQ